MEWAWLIVITVVYIICAYLTYKEEWRHEWWYIPVGCIFGYILVPIWYLVVRHIDDNDRIYFYSLCWDTLMVLVYYLLPIFLFGVKLNRNGVIGLLLMAAGLILLKVKV
jgi:multidrug transporter EmrE-like cation transporter